MPATQTASPNFAEDIAPIIFQNCAGCHRPPGGAVPFSLLDYAQFDNLDGWALGGNARELPDDLAMRLPKGADLILAMHFHPGGKAEEGGVHRRLAFCKGTAHAAAHWHSTAPALWRARG
jgi:mono/diheme cytochrome c family protein